MQARFSNTAPRIATLVKFIALPTRERNMKAILEAAKPIIHGNSARLMALLLPITTS